MDQPQLNWIANLRDLYVRGKYRDVILPMTVLRRLDAVLDMKASLDKTGIVHHDQALRQAAGQACYNTSKFTLRDLKVRASQQQMAKLFCKHIADEIESGTFQLYEGACNTNHMLTVAEEM